MDYLQASKDEMQKLKDYNTMLEMQIRIRKFINESCCNFIPIYNNPYSINCGCGGYNPINSTINNSFIKKEITIENKEVEKMIFDYNKEFVYQSEWDRYGYDLKEYNSISDDEKRLFKDCIYSTIVEFFKITCFDYIDDVCIEYERSKFFGNSLKNGIKYSFLKKDFYYDLGDKKINENLKQLNKKFQMYKNYKQNKQFIDKYHDKIVPDNIQTNYDYINELIKESEE